MTTSYNESLHHSSSSNSTLDPNTFIKIMELQNIISRSVYVYSIFGLVGLLTGIFILITYIRNFIKSTFETLDIFVFTVSVADFLLILFSFTDIVRPNTVTTSALCCAILSFCFNLPYFYTEYMHVAISFFLVFQQTAVTERALRKPLIAILAVISSSILWSVLITALIGVSGNLNKEVNCYLDPLEAPAKYNIVKFVFGFLLPTLTILGFILYFLIPSTNGPQTCRMPDYSCRVFLVLVTVTFICRLVYNILLLLRREVVDNDRNYKMEMMATVGELIMFVGSCLCLVCILIFDEKMRQAAGNFLSCITKPCWVYDSNRNRNNMNPTIEIKEQPEEAASLHLSQNHVHTQS
ncbi:uncharacterized protein LOC132399253 [Hypanus sabinus]|uniref:uncharacterized protein LOC132399253 n=1 Tax=Hypanus sabinus TaxID=79690 RepID=UPI0028C4972E|nr:uncharacterized protein LOC132399253 [Hypanus sabinus]XP_059835438.1 uncharacterized protein LOC132399253 [Hypanus sabinus]